MFRVWREVEIGKQGVVFPQHRALVRLGLFDLDDHFRTVENALCAIEDTRTGCFKMRIIHADAQAGRRFHEDLVTALRQFLDRGRNQANPVLVILDLFWHANLHS